MEWSLIFIILLSTFAAIGVYVMIRIHNKNRTLKVQLITKEKELHQKTKEITSLTLHRLKTEALNKTSLKKIRSSLYQLNPEKRKKIETILKEVESDTKENYWEEFNMAFTNLHIDFNKTLLSRYPDLTVRDLRLCAFIRLHLSTREISSITNQSPNSIDTARFRLRQKLGLSKNENISAFISQF